MFCNQCEQTAKGIGCTKIGVCGKTDDVAVLQDLLTYALQGLALVAVEGRKVGVVDKAINRFTAEATFACLTNVDFDPLRFQTWINTTVELREDLKKKVKAAGGVRTLDQLLAVQAAGCSRCGATATIVMIEEAMKRFGN